MGTRTGTSIWVADATAGTDGAKKDDTIEGEFKEQR